jgi:hypothetical protein
VNVTEVALTVVESVKTKMENVFVTRNEIYGVTIQSLPIYIRPNLPVQGKTTRTYKKSQRESEEQYIYFHLFQGYTAHCWDLSAFQFLHPAHNP